ncbi:MAG TPA: NrfD/PsrC family molybdoenzyme membrane anchor subunit [Sulfuriferula sp.]|nr:NrfD/PsrC family molybdoenzyme membrane anchor subunit [Sulfuriferula sp.]
MQIVFRQLDGKSRGYYGLLGGLGLLTLIGLFSAYQMEHHGHIITGMTNQVVWGMPHVFAVFLIVAASGVLNVASIATVFGKQFYKPLAPLSALLAIALLAGGLMVLMLDLGRADRLIVAMTHYNFKSVFAWNVFLYTGFFTLSAIYIWTMMDRKAAVFNKPVGFAAFFWRLSLTTGTGSLFGFLVARQAYDTALLAPMFIIMSFCYGLAVYLLVLMAAFGWSKRPFGNAVITRLKNLLGVFIAAVLYFVAVYHLTNYYFTRQHEFERFILLDGGVYTLLFWIGQILLGGVVPLILLYAPATRQSRSAIASACLLVVLGGLAQMYVTIIGGQAFPLQMFPGMVESSSFFDGVIHPYAPSLPETLLGLGGVAMAGAMVVFAIKILRFLPESLDDSVVNPHHKAG